MDSVEERVDGFGKAIQMATEFLGIEPVCQFLGFCHIADVGKGIVVAFVSDAVLVKHMLHQFPPI